MTVKVLMIEQFLPGSTYTLELGKELKEWTELTIFCKRGAAVPVDGIRWSEGFYEGGKNKGYAMMAYFSGLRKLDREMRGYDVVHVQNFKAAAIEIPFYLHRKGRCRFFVHTVHNLLPHEAVKRDRKLYRQFYMACDLLIVHNQHCRRLLIEEYQIPSEKICVIPHGAYTMIKKRDKRKQSGTVNFLQFGIFRQYKGIDILFQALSLIPKEQRKKIHVTVAGAQFPKLDPTDYFAMAERLGISEMVTVRCGHIPDEELDDLFGEADYCLFPYRNIYGSGALLMAYSYGKPVIVSDIPVFVEETEDGRTGALFTSEDPEDLKKVILQTVNWTKERYLACTDCIRKLVDGKHSWKNSAKALAEAYQKLWRN